MKLKRDANLILSSLINFISDIKVDALADSFKFLPKCAGGGSC